MAGSVVGALRVNLGLDSAQFIRGTKQAQSQMERMSARMTAAGVAMAGALGAAFGAITRAAVEGAVAQRQAVAQIESALTSMGNVAGRTSAQLVAAADQMELRSLFDADVILKQVTANLLTFGNVAGTQFDRAQQAALDMATRLGGEPQAAAIMLGKALNDPVQGLTALQKAGVKLTDDQKALIASMVQVGDVASAQNIILAEVERQFRGAAAAAADATPWRAFQVILGQVSDVLGEALLPALNSLRDFLLRNREQIVGTAQAAVQFAGSLIGLAQALSPLVAGFVAYRAILIAVAASQAAYTAAMVVATRAIGAAQAGALALNATLAVNPFTAVAAAVGVLTASFMGLANSQAQAKAQTDGLISSLKAAAQARSADFDVQRRALQYRIQVLENPANRQRPNAVQSALGLDTFVDAVNAEDTKELIRLRRELKAADEAYAAAGKAAQGIVVPTGNAATAVGSLGGSLRQTGGAARAAGDDFQRLYDRLFPYQAAMRQIDADAALIRSQKNLTEARKEELLAALEQERFRTRTRGLGQATVSGTLDPGPLVDFGKELGDLQKDSEVKTVRIAESFAQMSQRITSSLQGLANSVRSGDFLGILGGVLDIFTSLGSAGVFGSGLQGSLNSIPSFAGGGFTGNGARTGGLDGKGGRLAILHPRETVLDHTKGQGMGGRVHVTVSVDKSGNLQAFVDDQIMSRAPMIASASASLAQGQMAQRAQRRVR